jgi:hypothetical protein
MPNKGRTVWHAIAIPGGWLPWVQMQTPPHATPTEAHMVARSVRRAWPADLAAGRPDDGSQPDSTDAMADHHDLPLYC